MCLSSAVRQIFNPTARADLWIEQDNPSQKFRAGDKMAVSVVSLSFFTKLKKKGNVKWRLKF